MKPEVGKVIEFNGYGGIIELNNQEYLLLDNNIIDNKENIKVNDYVEFIPESVDDNLIARFVKKRYPKID